MSDIRDVKLSTWAWLIVGCGAVWAGLGWLAHAFTHLAPAKPQCDIPLATPDSVPLQAASLSPILAGQPGRHIQTDSIAQDRVAMPDARITTPSL